MDFEDELVFSCEAVNRRGDRCDGAVTFSEKNLCEQHARSYLKGNNIRTVFDNKIKVKYKKK